jgi:hypothetical protein
MFVLCCSGAVFSTNDMMRDAMKLGNKPKTPQQAERDSNSEEDSD